MSPRLARKREPKPSDRLVATGETLAKVPLTVLSFFTSGVLMLLGGYVLSQLLLIALGFIFTRKELVQV